MNTVDRVFGDITAYLRENSFSSVRELDTLIAAFLAMRNAQAARYVQFDRV